MSGKINVISNFKKKIFQYTRNRNRKATLNSLKDDYSFKEAKRVLKEILPHPFVKAYVYGSALPKELQDLRSGFYTIRSSFETEIDWLGLSFVKFKNEINEFVKARDSFESFFLLGRYDDAREVLKSINRTSHSIWAIENQFIIEEYLGGLEKNKEFLSTINKQDIEILVSLLADFYSNRAEKKLTSVRFYSIIEDFISGFNKGFQQYWSLKLNFYNTASFTEFADIISFESKSSVIDRYVTFLKIAQYIVCKGSDSQKSKVEDFISMLSNVIEDPLLRNLQLMFKPDTPFKACDTDRQFQHIVDLYTEGKYELAINLIVKELESFPSDFSLFELYIKCLFHLKQPFAPITSSSSLLNETLEDIYNIFEKNSNTGTSLSRLAKTVHVIESFSLSGQLFSFLQTVTPNKEPMKNILIGFLNCKLLNTRFYEVFSDIAQGLSYLKNIANHLGDGVGLRFHENYLLQCSGSLPPHRLNSVPAYRTEFYKAKSYIKINRPAEAIFIFENLLRLVDNKVTSEDIIVNLFDCYYSIHDYNKCVDLYVDSYLQNSNDILRFNLSNITEKIENSKFKNVYSSIKLPIFFFLAKKDNHSTNVALRVFLKANNIQKPPQLAGFLNSFNTDLLKELLLKVCIPEILKFSTYFKSTKEILNERLEIFQLLNKIDSNNNKLYKVEIRKLTQSLAIIEGVREVDESKIYVDERGLIANEFEEIKNNFNRYIEISKLIKEKPFFFIDLLDSKKFLSHVLKIELENEQDSERLRLSKNIKFGLFKELFFEILDRFLFSNKFGLDSYLSTRIRHGTLLGQLRSEFQKQILITQKDKASEEYYENSYWNDNLDVSENEKDNIQNFLALFSQKTDELANNLKEKYIQIKTALKNKDGLFDYDFSDQTLTFYYEHFFKTVDDYDLFIKGVLQLIWERTKTNLEIIQNLISVDIKEEITNNLIQLERNLKESVNDQSKVQELVNNITNCRTQIVSEIDKIADWFKLRESITSDFKIEKVVDTSIEITKKTSQVNDISANYFLDNDLVLKGEFFIHFFDLLRIFLENAVSYAGLPPAEVVVVINVNITANKLKIEIINNLNSETDFVKLESLFSSRRLDLSKTEWNMEVLKTEIGGTGFFKAKKILETNLLDDTNDMYFGIVDNNSVNVLMNINLERVKL